MLQSKVKVKDKVEQADKAARIALEVTIAETVSDIRAAWNRFNYAEQEMVDESIYEIKMLESRLKRLMSYLRNAGQLDRR